VAVNDTIVIADLAAGDHTVLVGGVAQNCVVAGGVPAR